MAKKQPDPTPEPEPQPEKPPALADRAVIIHLKGSAQYAQWLDDLANETHIAKAMLFRLAMAEYAKNHGHKLPPTR